MSTLEKKLQEAFDSVLMPQSLKADTLDFLENEAQRGADKGFFSSKEEVVIPEEQTSPLVTIPSAPASEPYVPVVVSGGQSGAAAKRTPRNSFAQRFGIAVAACFLLAAIGFGGFSAYATETALVGIDLNPSIELGVNRFDTVVAARALNEEGQRVLDTVSVTGKSYDEALSAITESKAFLLYIESEEDFVGVTVLCDNPQQADGLIQRSQDNLAMLPCESVSTQTSEEVWKAAQDAGMGVSRYEAAVALAELDSNITVHDCHSMKMSELRSRIAAIDPDNEYASHGKGQHHGQSSGQGMGAQDGSGQGNGSGQGSNPGSGGNGGMQGNSSGSGNGSGSGQGGGQGSRHGQEHS